MKKLLAFAILLCALPSWATWTIVQRKTGSSSGLSTCPVTVTSTGAGHLLVGGTATGNNVTISSVTNGGTWVLCGATCRAGAATQGFTDGAYVLSSTAAVTTITFNMSGSAGNEACFVEEWSSSTTYSFDVSNTITDTTCTSCAGVALTLTGSNDVIVQWSTCGGTCSGTVTGWTATYVTGDGVYDKPNTNSGAAPTVTQTSSVISLGAMAFKETGGAVATGFSKEQKLEKFWPQ